MCSLFNMFIKGFGSNTYLISTSERSSILFLHVASEVAIPSVIREEYFCHRKLSVYQWIMLKIISVSIYNTSNNGIKKFLKLETKFTQQQSND